MSGLPIRLARPELSETQVFAALIGAWQLETWTTYHPDGTQDFPFGRDAIGQIVYSADGHMSCHLMQANRPNFGVMGSNQIGDEALGAAMHSYSGYFGSFSIDAKAGVVTHHLAGSSFPDWTDSDQPRSYAFAKNRLFLEAEFGGDLIRIEWKRVVADYAADGAD